MVSTVSPPVTLRQTVDTMVGRRIDRVRLAVEGSAR
jgi:hypothetical protein